MKRRKIDPETKMVAVMEGLRREGSMADICLKYQISESLYYPGRDKFLAGRSQALSSRTLRVPRLPCRPGFLRWKGLSGSRPSRSRLKKF